MVQNYRAFTQVGATVYVFLNHRFKNEKKMVTWLHTICHGWLIVLKPNQKINVKTLGQYQIFA